MSSNIPHNFKHSKLLFGARYIWQKSPHLRKFVDEWRIYKSEKKRFFSRAEQTVNEMNIPKSILKSYKHSFRKHRFNFDEYYFAYRFHERSNKDMNEYMSISSMQKIYRHLVPPHLRSIFHKKELFLKQYEKYIIRDWLFVDDSVSFEKFKKFVDTHQTIVKPSDSTGGEGVYKIEKSNIDYESFYQKCKNERVLLEEMVVNNKEIAAFHPESLNTIRIVTLQSEGESIILHSTIRFGNGHSIADNGHSGGIMAAVDISNGKIVSDGFGCEGDWGNSYETHPLTGKRFKDFVIPQWEEAKTICLDASKELQDMYIIGWDVAIRDDGKIEFIEGNHAPDCYLSQYPSKHGMKKEILHQLKQRGISYK